MVILPLLNAASEDGMDSSVTIGEEPVNEDVMDSSGANGEEPVNEDDMDSGASGEKPGQDLSHALLAGIAVLVMVAVLISSLLLLLPLMCFCCRMRKSYYPSEYLCLLRHYIKHMANF